MAPGRPFTRETTISPFSKGTIREYSVVQIAWSSLVMRSTVCSPNFSMQSLFEEAKYCQGS